MTERPNLTDDDAVRFAEFYPSAGHHVQCALLSSRACPSLQVTTSGVVLMVVFTLKTSAVPSQRPALREAIRNSSGSALQELQTREPGGKHAAGAGQKQARQRSKTPNYMPVSGITRMSQADSRGGRRSFLLYPSFQILTPLHCRRHLYVPSAVCKKLACSGARNFTGANASWFLQMAMKA
eukprot:3061695-Rhodomonas_salina.1